MPGPLLPLDRFGFIRETFAGQTVGYAFSHGFSNAGDHMIHLGTRRVFREFDIPLVDYLGPETECDVIAWAGGGNMGYLYGPESGCAKLRYEILAGARGRPIVILPQSYSTLDPFPASRIFVRERDSLRLAPRGAELAPDLALAYQDDQVLPDAQKPIGTFIRDDLEGIQTTAPSDPILWCKTAAQYVELASRYENILTDRLHFATAALLAGRSARLLPNIYHKNRSMYWTWLRDLGCQWNERFL